jgi:hypothetical protein
LVGRSLRERCQGVRRVDVPMLSAHVGSASMCRCQVLAWDPDRCAAQFGTWRQDVQVDVLLLGTVPAPALAFWKGHQGR